MRKIAFHSNQLCIRGTEVALFDYAHYNETILGNKSYIISDANKDLQALKKFQDRFEVFLYDKFEDCFSFIKEKNITDVYYQKAGHIDNKIVPGVRNLIHAVFQHKEIHGDAYCYISKWLAEKQNMDDSYVPYIVAMPEPTKNYRAKLGISEDKIVIGRHGGATEFDLPATHKAIYDVLKRRNDLVFLFMNTNQFGPSHPNIIFVEGTYNLQNKSNFIDTCDYMIHARNHGESFGLAICEFLFHNKPVISWKAGLDQNHISLMGDKGLWYTDYDSCVSVLNSVNKTNSQDKTYKQLVEQFTPENVMSMFNQKFLNNTNTL